MGKDGAGAGKTRWLNRNVWGMAITSFLSDTSHEMATAVLPSFLAALGSPPVVLGAIEGVSDALSSLVKLGAGWYSDRAGKRKGIVVAGYLVTGVAMSLFALAKGWDLVLGARVMGWLGRGVRGPLRDAILADSVEPEDRGKAFGFHRAGDTMGAIVGPMIAAALLGLFGKLSPGAGTAALRYVFVVTLIPGIASALAFALMVTERPVTGGGQRNLWATLQKMPHQFRRYLVGIGVFGAGDFSHTLLILAAAQILSPSWGSARAAQFAALLYVVRNISYAFFSYPVGALSDRMDRRSLLTAGYVVAAAVMVAFGLLFAFPTHVEPALVVLFVGAGLFIATEDALEGALTADLVPDETVRATAFGLLGVVNAVGDLASSVVVGVLWVVAPWMAFAYAALVMLAGSVVMGAYR